MSPGKLIFSTALISLFSMPLQANDYYFGASIGYGSLNENAPSLDTDAFAASLTAPEGLSLVGQPTADFSYHIADDDYNWKFYGGFNFNRYFSAEIGYANLGKSYVSTDLTAEMTTTLPDPLTGTQTSGASLASQSSIKSSGFLISGIARYPFVNKFNYTTFSVYGKVGAIWWDTDVDTRQTLVPFSLQTEAGIDPPDNDPSTSNFSSGDKGINFAFGVGADYLFTNNIGIRAEWSYYRGIDDRDINFFSLGAFYQFWL